MYRVSYGPTAFSKSLQFLISNVVYRRQRPQIAARDTYKRRWILTMTYEAGADGGT
ncbi:hypothetical protein RRU01S_05_00160 [Agrobacterium rubi TR3 = NBRC 13261]|uniref:Uncharacterized protein n=1 Tax=Agrobacterium rubi TR3 = NBRC 13261 TaxID=1368415 RepID=A0A081CRS8_9HYPH|nr:hypothetical protein RRU01S_05_00160 [Agrobacterium rubi TR3 = NBRC 13261]